MEDLARIFLEPTGFPVVCDSRFFSVSSQTTGKPISFFLQPDKF